MPELPDIEAYRSAIADRLVGASLEGVRLASPFLLRSVDPSPRALVTKQVKSIERIGKRIVFAFEGDLFAVIHLMIAGRFQWKDASAPIPKKLGLAAFDFKVGTLLLTEASTKKRASLHIVSGREALRSFDRGGLEVLDSSLEEFDRALRAERHTLKRALTDPRILSGIGNAYSDEILHAAGLSPVLRTDRMTASQMELLHRETVAVLNTFKLRLEAEAKIAFPAKVTAFRADMAVHGKYDQPCPRCTTLIQRVVYAENESNYCPRCQTDGKLLADRSLSKLLKDNWPKTIDELEQR